MTDLDARVVDSVDAVNENQWNNLVEQAARGSVFHRHGWLRAVEAGLDRAGRHVVVAKDGNPVAVLPNVLDALELGEAESALPVATDRVPLRRLVSTEPGYGGPLVQTDTDECLDRLFERLDADLDGRVVYHTIKTCDQGYVRYGKDLARRGFSPSVLSCRFVLDLGRGLEAIEDDMDRSRRRALRRGREQDIDVAARSIDEAPLEELYRAYWRNMRRVDGTAYPRSFFAALREHLPDRTTVFTARREGDVIGRFVHLEDEEQSALRYFFSAVADESSYEYNVSEVLHARAMAWGADRGFDTYDFGATGADYTDGLFTYKEKYGGRAVPILQWQRGHDRLLWPLYRLGRTAYQRVRY